MLANFFNSEAFRQTHNISFSYRQSVKYTQGFKRRVNSDLPVYPVTFPDLSDLSIPLSRLRLPELGERLIMAILRLLLTTPLFFYEIMVLFLLFKKLGPDVLHINNGGYPGALSARAAVIAGVLAGVPKVLMVVNNMAVDYKRLSRWSDCFIDYLVVRSVDLFITGSEAAATQLSSVLNIPKQKVMAIHNGIAMRSGFASIKTTRERLGLENFNGVVFGVVALLIARKGHEVLLKTILKLVEDGKLKDNSLKILIEGNGALRQNLGDFVNNNNLTRWVTFVGDESNITDFMSALDALILPSVQDEDFPNVILEAMALGKPVIASRLAGIPEQVVDGVTGLLVEPRNVEQLGVAICHLVDNPITFQKMSHAALSRFSKQFTYQTALDNYSKMYIKLFETRK